METKEKEIITAIKYMAGIIENIEIRMAKLEKIYYQLLNTVTIYTENSKDLIKSYIKDNNDIKDQLNEIMELITASLEYGNKAARYIALKKELDQSIKEYNSISINNSEKEYLRERIVSLKQQILEL